MKNEFHDRITAESPTPDTYINLAKWYWVRGEQRSAISVLTVGVERCMPDEQLFDATIFALEQGNLTDEAVLVAHRAAELFPNAGYFRLAERLLLPVLYEDPLQIQKWRSRFSIGLKEVANRLKLNTPEENRRALAAIGRHINFYLGYQGQNDRCLQAQYGHLVHRIMAANYPEWVKSRSKPKRPVGSRIRIGYVSAHFRNHSVAKLFMGWLRERNQEEFEVFVYHNGNTTDYVTDEIRRFSDHFYHIPDELEPLSRTVLADDLQVLVYLDVRHRRMLEMCSLRLAPVQCSAWAHPVTSGSPNIDYFLSGDLMEPANGQEHYVEKLIRLPGIGVCYPKPVIPRPLLKKTRHEFGLGTERTVYLCCQSSFKYLPQHDDLFVRIAKRDPTAQFVFLAMNDLIADELQRRLDVAFKVEGLSATEFCVTLQRLNFLDYWNLNLIADVFLDTLEWSGGVTTLEAIACGLPVVTLPGELMRGRHSYGILTQLGISETIARSKDEYVKIAVRLGQDHTWRARILQSMASNFPRLYNDTQCVGALEDFYRSAVRGCSSAPITELD